LRVLRGDRVASMTPGTFVMVRTWAATAYRGRYGSVVAVHPESGTVTVKLLGVAVPLPFAGSEIVRAA
jgi:hypothetical protein